MTLPSPCGSPLLYTSETLSLYHAVEPPNAGQEHAHDTVQVSLPLRGSYAASWETPSGRTLRQTLSPGTLLLCASQQPHAIDLCREAELGALWLPSALLAQAADDLNAGSAALELTGAVQDPLLHALCVSLLTELRENPAPPRLFVESSAHLLAARLLRRCSVQKAPSGKAAPGLPPRRLRCVLSYIQENLSRDIALADLAACCHLSPHHFARLFKQSTGQPPHQYVIAQRVEKAKSLLRCGGLTVGEVAQVVGFSDHSKLHHHFKKLTGLTPRQYSKR